MIGKITGLSKKELREDILNRMSALDTTSCENSNEELVKDFVGLLKNNEEEIKFLQRQEKYLTNLVKEGIRGNHFLRNIK